MKNSMKTPDQKKRSKQLGKEIRDSRKRYEDLRVHGGSDPFWSDGVNMNLCRNHVMYFRKQVETELDPENYPEEYFLEIPAEEAFIIWQIRTGFEAGQQLHWRF